MPPVLRFLREMSGGGRLRRMPTLSSSRVRMSRCAFGLLASSTISSRSALLHTAMTCRPRPACPGCHRYIAFEIYKLLFLSRSKYILCYTWCCKWSGAAFGVLKIIASCDAVLFPESNKTSATKSEPLMDLGVKSCSIFKRGTPIPLPSVDQGGLCRC